MRLQGILMLSLPLLVAACGAGDNAAPETPQQVRNVVVQVANPQPLNVTIKLPVVIMPREELDLRAAAPGKIVELPYAEGDIVPAGRLPAAEWLEVDEFLARQPEGAAKPTVDQIALRNLRHLDGVVCFVRIDSSQLRESFREAQASYDQAVRDLRRTEEYPQSTGAQLDQARTKRNIARAAVGRMLAMIEDTYVFNPIEGVLTDRMRSVGEYANGGETIGHVAVMDKLVAELEIPEAHLQGMRVGAEMNITIGSLKEASGKPMERVGKIARIASVAHPQTHSFTVELEIPNEDMSLPAGVFGTVYVTIYSNPNAMLLPLSAIRLNGEARSIFVTTADTDTVTELKDIKLGRLNLEWIEVTDERLKPGMRVVTFGVHTLNDGDRVSATETDPYAAVEAK